MCKIYIPIESFRSLGDCYGLPWPIFTGLDPSMSQSEATNSRKLGSTLFEQEDSPEMRYYEPFVDGRSKTREDN